VIYQDISHIITLVNFPWYLTYQFLNTISQQLIIKIYTQEVQIILAIKTIRISKNLSYRNITKLYKVPYFILNNRINNYITILEYQSTNIKLFKLKKEVII